jgi:phage tail protein X
MARQALALEGETVDEVPWRVLFATRSVVEQVLELNPGLGAGPRLPAGTVITLPGVRVRCRADPRNCQPVGLNRCARSTACAKPRPPRSRTRTISLRVWIDRGTVQSRQTATFGFAMAFRLNVLLMEMTTDIAAVGYIVRLAAHAPARAAGP